MTAPAYRAGGASVSREQFYAIACDPRRSVVVEACAGAGKTWMLVSRILRALLDGARPQEILAITFTRKAAGEMRERLAEWLQAFSATASTAAQREHELRERGVPAAHCAELAERLAGLQRALLDGGRPVEVCTFHAWFAQLVRAAPLELLDELGLQPQAQLIEEFDEHRPELMRRFHAALLREPALRADHAALIARRGRHQAARWFDAVIERRVELGLAEQAGTLDASVAPAVPPGSPAPPAELLGAAWADTLRTLAAALDRGGKKAQDAAEQLRSAVALDTAEARLAALWSALFTGTGTPRKLGEIDGLAAAQQALERVAGALLQHEAWLEHAAMVRLSRVLLAEYAAYKHARGLLDMNDLEQGALALLRDATLAGWVQERLDTRIRQVLIDEFQDTSPLQWHALHAWLSAYAGAGGGASGQRSPAVFIVGDPKQSIYRFRRAEPRVFAAARHFVVEALGGSVLECDHTRRNTPGVLAAINAAFAAAQGRGAFDGFRAHTTEVMAQSGPAPALRALARVPRPAARDTAAGTAAGEAAPAWRDSLTEPRHEPEELLREQEAAQVATAIAAALADGGFRPRDVMVLCRKRESLRLVAQALQALHLPVAAAEESPLLDAAEALDLLAVLDVLASPRHRLSLARALRSPLFGAGDDDLVALATQAAETGDWWAALTTRPQASPVLQRAAMLLSRWQAWVRRLPPHDLLDRIVAEGELRERVAATVPAERRAAALDNLDALLAQSLLLDAGRYATPYGLVRALKRRAPRVAAPAHPEAVQLLTVHGAKGLEAELVFVMDADPEVRNADTATLLVDWPVEAPAPRRCAFLYSESRCPPELRELLAREQQARQREELNGLYVAMTRARQHLVISATAPHRVNPNGPSWWQQLEPLAEAWRPQPPAAGPAAAMGEATILALPAWQGAARAPTANEATADESAARLGRALHRLLEWATAGGAELPRLAAAAAAEFGAPADEVERLGTTILASPACARFFAGPALRWAGNEVPVGLDGQVLRIDRLVLLEEAGAAPVWWVLDYKLQHRPQQLAAYREQLAGYAEAVRRAQPGAMVRSAFIAGDGSLVEPG